MPDPGQDEIEFDLTIFVSSLLGLVATVCTKLGPKSVLQPIVSAVHSVGVRCCEGISSCVTFTVPLALTTIETYVSFEAAQCIRAVVNIIRAGPVWILACLGDAIWGHSTDNDDDYDLEQEDSTALQEDTDLI